MSAALYTGPLTLTSTTTLQAKAWKPDLTESGVAEARFTKSSAAAPTLTFSAAPAALTAGQRTTLSWSSANATTCTASGGWTGAKAVSGSETLSPTSTTTYTLSCMQDQGVVSRNVTVTVGASPSPYTLTAAPSSLRGGGTLMVSWTAPPSGVSASDWVGLYASGAPNPNYLAFQYTGGGLTGTKTFPAPASPGTYEVRYLLKNGYTSVAVASVTVQ
jgi:hypothetical protein